MKQNMSYVSYMIPLNLLLWHVAPYWKMNHSLREPWLYYPALSSSSQSHGLPMCTGDPPPLYAVSSSLLLMSCSSVSAPSSSLPASHVPSSPLHLVPNFSLPAASFLNNSPLVVSVLLSLSVSLTFCPCHSLCHSPFLSGLCLTVLISGKVDTVQLLWGPGLAILCDTLMAPKGTLEQHTHARTHRLTHTTAHKPQRGLAFFIPMHA